MENICGICHDDLNDDIQILDCGHKFHYECILESYLSDKKGYKYERKCPYCRKNGGYLELKPNSIPKKDIHKEYYKFSIYVKNNNTEKLANYLDNNKCLTILKSGPNKGLQCSCKIFAKNYCKKHYKGFLNTLI